MTLLRRKDDCTQNVTSEVASMIVKTAFVSCCNAFVCVDTYLSNSYTWKQLPSSFLIEDTEVGPNNESIGTFLVHDATK